LGNSASTRSRSWTSVLHDAGDQLAHAIAVLLEHHVALGLADPLEDHLLGRLRRDTTEVVRGDVLGVDLVLVFLELLEVDLGLGRLAHLAGLRIDGGLLVRRRLDQELLLELGRDLQLPDLEVTAVAVHLHLGVAGRIGRLLVGGQERVFERLHQLLGGDVLLGGEAADGLDDLSRHDFSLQVRGWSGRFARRGS
jgi:hypothetical protein